MGDAAAVKKIATGLVIGFLAGAFAMYALVPLHNDEKMKELETNIDALTKKLAVEQKNAGDSIAALQIMEEQKKKTDEKIKGDFDELQRTTAGITDAAQKLKVQIKILHSVLCDYSNDFCNKPKLFTAGTR